MKRLCFNHEIEIWGSGNQTRNFMNGRNSDNTLIKKYLNWEPGTTLANGLQKTYRWIYEQHMSERRGATEVLPEDCAVA